MPLWYNDKFANETVVDNLSATIQTIASNQASSEQSTSITSAQLRCTIDDMKLTLEAFTHGVNSRIDHLNAACTTLITSTQNATAAAAAARCTSQAHSAQNSTQTDRNENIIIFGVPEDRDANQWRGRVNDVMSYVADHAIDTVDMYRLGRYDSNKTRPILVKLRTVWDKRILLSKCRKLKDYTHRGIYIAPDEPLDIRRKQTFDRLKYRAEREGKSTNAVNGVLYVDDRATFSLADGYIKSTIPTDG